MKKTILLLIILLAFVQSSISQVVSAGSKDFRQIQQSFYNNFDGTLADTSESGDFRQFIRWEMFWGPRLMPHYNFDTAIFYHNNFAKNFDPSDRENPIIKSNWEELGPKVNGLGGVGRVDAIAFHPTDSNTIYAGCPSGGVWVSYNRGQNWQNLNTDQQLPALGVSSIAIDPIHPENIFIGTGDVDSEWVYSAGIYRSADTGQTWEQAGLNWLATPFTIGKVLLHPTDTSVAFAATSLGIYKTENRNAQNPSWMKVYPAVTEDFEYVRNIAFHPTNPQILFATGINIISSSSNGNLNTWNSIATAENGLDFANTPFPNAFGGEEYVQSINMVISSQGDFLYINCVNRDGPPPFNWQSEAFYHVFRYDILNDSWSDIPITGLMGGRFGSGLTAGRTEMAVSPHHANLLYSAGVRLYRFDTNLPDRPWRREQYEAHLDFHELVFSPYEENVLYAGTDGGIYKKDMTDIMPVIDGAGELKGNLYRIPRSGLTNGHPTFELNNGLGVATIYNFGSSAIDPYQVLTGSQDCGIGYLKNGVWSAPQNPSDGFQCLMDETDIDLMYATIYHPTNGSIYRSKDNCLNPSWDILMKGYSPVNEQAWFGASLVADPANSKTLFQARLNLWKVDDAATATLYDWYKITDINLLTAPLWGNNNCVSYALEIAPSNPDYIYFSAVKMDSWATQFDANRIFKTTVGGGTNAGDWIDITPPTPGNSEGTFLVSDIAVSSSNPNKIWISYSGFLEDYKVKYYDGSGWSDYNQGLPNIPVNCIIYANESNDALFIGTDVGVYYRDADMSQWEPFMTNLPNVMVFWLELNYTNNKLRAGTFGRGLWETDVPDFKTIRNYEKMTKDFLAGKTDSGRNNFLIYPNPNKGIFTVAAPPDAETIKFTIYDISGKQIGVTETQKSNSVAKLELDKKQAGFYFLHIETAKVKYVRKIVVE